MQGTGNRDQQSMAQGNASNAVGSRDGAAQKVIPVPRAVSR